MKNAPKTLAKAGITRKILILLLVFGTVPLIILAGIFFNFDEVTIVDLNGNEISKVSRYYTFRPFELGTVAETAPFKIARTGKIHVSSKSRSTSAILHLRFGGCWTPEKFEPFSGISMPC